MSDIAASAEYVVDNIRCDIIEADNKIAVRGDQVVESPDRFDLESREDQALELARLVGVREGLAMARVIVEKYVESP